MTRLRPEDPRPVFRLRRGRSGTGLFFGACASAAAFPLVAEGGWVLLLAGGASGWFAGSFVRSDVCSEPSCRAELPRGVEECPRCRGTILGTIAFAHEHYARAAEVRRELAADRARRRRARRAAKPASGSSPRAAHASRRR